MIFVGAFKAASQFFPESFREKTPTVLNLAALGFVVVSAYRTLAAPGPEFRLYPELDFCVRDHLRAARGQKNLHRVLPSVLELGAVPQGAFPCAADQPHCFRAGHLAGIRQGVLFHPVDGGQAYCGTSRPAVTAQHVHEPQVKSDAAPPSAGGGQPCPQDLAVVHAVP